MNKMNYGMSSDGRNTPKPIARLLRQEANFGCAVCGCPILEYAHIIPYHITHAFKPEDMIALCPTDHTRFDNDEYGELEIREIKRNPHNKDTVQDSFHITSQNLTVDLGSNIIIDTPKIIEVDNFGIISVNRDNKFPLLDVNIYDIQNNRIGEINRNDWIIDTTLVWDVEYKPRHLTIRNAPRNILFDAEIKDDVVYIKGKLYYNGYPILITKDEVLVGSTRISGCTIENCGSGLSVRTQ